MASLPRLRLVDQIVNAAGQPTFRFQLWWQQVLDRAENPIARSYTVATLPSAANAGLMIFVSNEAGGAVLAFSDGTNFRRVTDRAVVS